MNTLTILTKARDLISDPARWTQEEFAKDRSGSKVYVHSSHAVCWCAMGAIYKIYGVEIYDQVMNPTFDLLHAIAGMAASDFNDTHTHAEVLAVFDKAIAEAAKE